MSKTFDLIMIVLFIIFMFLLYNDYEMKKILILGMFSIGFGLITIIIDLIRR